MVKYQAEMYETRKRSHILAHKNARRFINYASRYPASIEAQAAQLALDSIEDPHLLNSFAFFPEEGFAKNMVIEAASKAHEKSKQGSYRNKPPEESVGSLAISIVKVAEALLPHVDKLPQILSKYDRGNFSESNKWVKSKIMQMIEAE